MGILRYQGINYGSLLLIEYIAAYQVTAFYPISKSRITAEGIALADGATWQKIYCSEDTMGHRQQMINDDNGESWQHTIVGFVPGDQDDIEDGLLDLENKRYLVRITRPDGRIKIVGTPKQPLDIKIDSDSQSTVPGPAGTAITFSAITSNRALIYTP